MLRIQEITAKYHWESFLTKHCPGALFQSWSWGEVERRLGHTVWRLGVSEGSKLMGLFQIVKVEAKRGPFLHVRHGPVLTAHTPRLWQTVAAYLVNLGKANKVWFIRVSPLASDSIAMVLRNLGFYEAAIQALDAEDCWVLDLRLPETELLTNMRKTTRYEIRRAQKLGVVVRQSAKARDLTTFARLYEETGKRQGFVPHRGIGEEFAEFTKEDRASLFLAEYQGTTLAGAVVLFYGGQAIYHHGASQASPIPASTLVQWEAIREAKKRGMKVYNFWGVAPDDNPRHPWRGLSLFKTGFGGRRISYLHAQDLPISPFYIIPRAVEMIRRLYKGY